MSPSNQPGGLSVNSLLRLVSERDLQIMELLYQHRYLTTRQLQRLIFWDHATISAGTRACTRVLTRLRVHRLITRLERPIGGTRGGSAASTWTLDYAGGRVMQARHHRQARLRPDEPTIRFLAHTLAVAEVRVLIEEAARDGKFELLEIIPEPATWRRYTARSINQILKPDLSAATATAEYEDRWFLEIDLASESQPTLLKKCHDYEDYRTTGQEQNQHGVFPLVVWLIADPKRRTRLVEAIRDDRRLDQRLFAVIAPDKLIGFLRTRAIASGVRNE